MENLVMNRDFWRGKRVFLTGHTGFKGGWLTLWLKDMGAEVHGYALPPPTTPNFFSACNLQEYLKTHTVGDIRDITSLTKAIRIAEADIVFHLAAQSLVRYSYQQPVDTYEINVMGTVNLLEAVRQVSTVKAVVNITTDKCYENQEWIWPYRENEKLGGYDPYSNSKACAELVTAAYRNSFFKTTDIKVASARAGNVIGGGDWAPDRLIPDFFRAIDAGLPLIIRSPSAVRPWQHVLQPLSGYLKLAEMLYNNESHFAEAWNFGPNEADARTVQWIVEFLAKQAPEIRYQYHTSSSNLHEANNLRLDSSKAKAKLGWTPHWNLATALTHTFSWHQTWKQSKNDMSSKSFEQIHAYEASQDNE